MEIFYTVLSGVLVYVLGQFILKIWIEPIQELKKNYQIFIDDWIFYNNIISNMNINDEKFNKEKEKVAEIIRKHASKLNASYVIIPFNQLFVKLKIIPNVDKIISSLIRVSNILKLSSNKNEDLKEIINQAYEDILTVDKSISAKT